MNIDPQSSTPDNTGTPPPPLPLPSPSPFPSPSHDPLGEVVLFDEDEEQDSDDDVIIDEESFKPPSPNSVKTLLEQQRWNQQQQRQRSSASPGTSLGTIEIDSGEEEEGEWSDDSESSVSIQSYYSSSSSENNDGQSSPFQLSTNLPFRSDSYRQTSTSTSPPFEPRQGIPLPPSTYPPSYPLPRPPYDFNPLSHNPYANPSLPSGYVSPSERELNLKAFHEEERQEGRRRDRERRQREVREGEEERWRKDWEELEWKREREGRKEDKAKGKEKIVEPPIRCVSFFPYAKLEGLEWLRDTFAVVQGGTIELFQCPDESTSTNYSPFLISRIESRNSTALGKTDREEYLTCSWSVNVTTWPFTPMLAVAGRGRVIEIYLVGKKKKKQLDREFGKGCEVVLYRDRTITGHGLAIHHLSFHPLHPHLLISASEDRTMRLWDVTIPWGSDRYVSNTKVSQLTQIRKIGGEEIEGEEVRPKKRVKSKGFTWDKAAKRNKRLSQGVKGVVSEKTIGKREKEEEEKVVRPRVEGELLGILTGHTKGVFSCDFHPTLPFVVSTGGDSRIKLWLLPPQILSSTPTWPKSNSNLYRHPTSPPSRSFLHPRMINPYFSTIHVHRGQWPLQVQFLPSTKASTASLRILSTAQSSHGDESGGSSKYPRMECKVWEVESLSSTTMEGGNFQDHFERVETNRSSLRGLLRRDDELDVNEEEGVGGQESWTPLKPRIPPEQSDELGFKIQWSCVLEGIRCIGDRIGVYDLNRGPFKRSFEQGQEEKEEEESFFVVPTSTRLPRSAELDEEDRPALYFFRPFAPPPIASTSTSTTTIATSKPKAAEEVEKLFPSDRERPIHDFTPRLKPSLVIDVSQPSTSTSMMNVEKSRKEDEDGELDEMVHFRCLTVSPDGARWIVGVGDGGLRRVWRRVEGEKGERYGRDEKEEDIAKDAMR